jgi:DNA-binding MurR/RpiR family transcriptional regulator
VSRFVRRLGFANFEEMRRLAREEREAGAPLFLLDKSFGNGGLDPIDRHLDTVSENLRKTYGALDRAAFAGFIERIAATPQVWIAGFRHGYPIAKYLHWSMVHARPNIRLLPRAGETFGESLIDLSAGDVMIVLAMRRRVPVIETLISTAMGAGAEVAVLTDPGYVAAAEATWVFRCESRSKGPIDDHASVLVLAHLITEALIARLGKAARNRLGRIDDLHDELGEL